jgi:hypothetical protein
VNAGSFASAIAVFGAAPNADPIKQKQRLALMNAVIVNPGYAISTFAWLVVSLAASEPIADSFIASTITAQFDNIASQLFISITS